ncbi:MAG: cation:proton antiporter [Actinobacteria bacterium]|nr:cation:proton antiporter [Actinomycetota bacterium]
MPLAAALAESGASQHGIATPVSLILIATAAFAIPLVANRVRLPAIVLEILFGVLVGPVLGVIEPGEDLLGFLAEFGLFLLMFLAGFEIDFARIERQGRAQLVGGVALFVLYAGAAFAATPLLGVAGLDERLFLSFLLSAAALGLVIPALRATGRSDSRLGQVVIITAVFAEVLSLVGIVVVGVLVESGPGWELLAIPALIAAMALVLVVLRRAAWWYPERFARLFRPDDPQEMGTRASIALLFVSVGLSALLGVEAILGAFLAGALFTFVFRDRGVLEEQLSGFGYGFFIPVFFINVGIEFPLSEVASADVFGHALALIGVAFAVKTIPSLVLGAAGFSLREALGAGVLLAGQLSVIIALADYGLALGLLSPGLRAGAIMLVAVSAVVSPVAFRWLVPPSQRPAAESEEAP